jgi:molecular chaperone DnaJ
MDPYKVLGIQPTATNDEVKKAYREQSRKYHPDNVVNNPLADLAEEKFKEVQEAYSQIMNEREHGGSSYGSSNYSSSSYSGANAQDYNAIRNLLNGRRYRDALNALSGMNSNTGEWHYLYAVANAGIGNNIEAMNHARQAVDMEPSNREYASFLDQLQMMGNRYQTNSTSYGRNNECGTGNMCCDLWCADSLCECMGGDLCSCM